MRENWNRAAQTLEFANDQLTKLIAPILPRREVVASAYTVGGLANTNIRLELSDATSAASKANAKQGSLLLRIFTRDPQQAEKEYRIYERIKGLVPAPEVYYFSSTNPVSGHPYLIMELVEGDRLETFVDTLDRAWSTEVGQSVGAALAAIHSVTFDREGFLNQDLIVDKPITPGSTGLYEYCHRCVGQELAFKRLGPDLAPEVIKFVEMESPLLDQWKRPPCLVHADFGGSNILVARRNGCWRVTAVLDWEFALSASPFMDFGNLLRPPLGTVEGFARAVADGHRSRGGELPADWRKMSKLVDLTAWLDFLSRPAAGERLVADAKQVIAQTMQEWYQKR